MPRRLSRSAMRNNQIARRRRRFRREILRGKCWQRNRSTRLFKLERNNIIFSAKLISLRHTRER